VRHKRVSCVLAVLLIGGCGGGQANLRSENQTLTAKISQLRAQARRDRGAVRDLENQVFLLEDRLETARLAAERAGPPIQLPVEVLEPDGESAEVDDAPGEHAGGGLGEAMGDEEYKVVGVDHEGNPIIYAGEAASDRTVRPNLALYQNSGGRADDERRSQAAPRLQDPPPAPPERIPALHGSLPTVGEQLRERRRQAPAAPVVADDSAARDAYKRYYSALRSGNHAHAITGFRTFVKDYPDHDYADNAQYWLGEAYYDQQQFKNAMREFRAVVDKYPRGNKVPDALLKVGYCYAALGRLDKGRAVLAQVVAIYPKSGPAKLATRRLEELREDQE